MPESNTPSKRKKKSASSKSISKQRHIKIAITIPSEVFEKIELARASSGVSRSQFLLTAVQQWFSELKRQNLSNQYVNGYEMKPEDPAFSSALEVLQVRTIEQESW